MSFFEFKNLVYLKRHVVYFQNFVRSVVYVSLVVSAKAIFYFLLCLVCRFSKLIERNVHSVESWRRVWWDAALMALSSEPSNLVISNFQSHLVVLSLLCLSTLVQLFYFLFVIFLNYTDHNFIYTNPKKKKKNPTKLIFESESYKFWWKDGLGSVRRVYDGLLLDAGGTLLQLAKPVEETYATIGTKYGEFCRFGLLGFEFCRFGLLGFSPKS